MEIRMKRNTALLGFALSLVAATAGAGTPPPNFSQQVDLCNGRLQAKVDIVFGQTATTATVRTKSSPIKLNPFVAGGTGPDPLEYSVFVASSVKKNASSAWSIASTQQDGFVGVAQSDVSVGHSTFKDYACQIKGTVTLSTACPPQSSKSRDEKTIERNWIGCGL